MSGEVLETTTAGAKDFHNSLPGMARTALFNPMKKARDQALQQLRASSAFTPDQWNELDAAVGIKDTSPRAELTADSSLTVDSWADYADVILEDQFVEGTLIDTLIGAGFSASSSLWRYAYFNQIRNVRLEAETGMNIRTQSTQDMPAYGLDGIPQPLDVVTYEIDAREYENAQAHGESFDASVGTEARRALNRKEGKRVFDGWGGGNKQVPTERGLLTVDGLDSDIPQIMQDSSNGWQNAPDEILADVKQVQDLIESQTDVEDEDDVPLVREVGAWVIIPRALWGEVDREDYESSATDEPLMERLERKYPYINFVPSKYLDADSMIFLLNDPRYFQIVNAQGVTSTTWDVDGGAGLKARVLSSRNPFIRLQPDGIRGIARITGIDA
ncbi:bacteriocin [Halostagnicola sp. A56]|uniref:bacteriocin n=1 Tax=Halostagnicola sp. A56 TaxID=1495067 RepID=UPI0004A08E78|nr:bacteriocin [Halostagnicola sp. A56]KDE59817.1 bacteriocin [Halostagnicola sp. A56]